MTQAELQQLKSETEGAIAEVRLSKLEDAVNWADLHCHEACWVRDHSGNEWAEVRIEEADPSAQAFHKALYDILARRGYPKARVITEW